uniref:Uncharacterized protein n=1 Tax=Cacopsylla melanoneura TaxID=428564 RepID=A0A8D8THB0_9HEMI
MRVHLSHMDSKQPAVPLFRKISYQSEPPRICIGNKYQTKELAKTNLSQYNPTYSDQIVRETHHQLKTISSPEIKVSTTTISYRITHLHLHIKVTLRNIPIKMFDLK